MSIFNKRPLSIVLTLMLGVFVIFSILDSPIKWFLLIFSPLPYFISLILKSDRNKRIYSLILSALLLVSFILSYIYFDLDFKIYKRYKSEVDIIATVEELEQSSSYSIGMTVKTKTIDNAKVKGYKIICYVDAADCRNVDIGDTVSFTSYISDFDDVESRNYNFSKGISARVTNIKDFTLKARGGFNLAKLFSFCREYISRYTAMISDADSGSLLSALLAGERDNLSSKTRLDFKRIGISHILALSGMHLSILSLGITNLLTLLKVKKKLRTVLIIGFVTLYMGFTGFSVSVVRAGLMLIISSLLFLFSKPKDSITSLVSAVFIICTITPYAIYDIALWLSAFATFGILILSEYLRESKLDTSLKKPTVYISSSLLCTVFAVSCTLLISTFTFGGISLFSIISTFIFSILTEIIMYLGCIMLIIGWLIPIKYVFIPFCTFTTKLAEIFSSARFAYYSNDNALSIILVIALTVIVASFATFKMRNRKRFIILLCTFYALTTLAPFVQAVYKTSTTESVVYYSKNKCDEFLIQSDSEVCLINSSQYSKSQAYATKELLNKNGITYIDKYIITHYGFNLRDDFDVILSSYLTERIYLPKPQNSDEEYILKSLKKTVSEYSADIIIYDKFSEIKLGTIFMTPLLNVAYGEGTSTNAFVLHSYENTILYLSSGVLDQKDKEKYHDYISVSDQIIFGSHGKKYNKDLYLPYIDGKTKRMIFGSPNLFLTQETMGKHIEKGCEIISHPKEIELLK